MDLVEATLLEAGVDAERIFVERFVNAGQSTAAAVDADGEVPETVTLILKGKRNTIAYQPGDTVLETARRGGLQAPFSCESGNCATCMALVCEGSATMRVNNALTPDEVAEGWVLTCQALPKGRTVTVEYESF
jgi:ferredoxin